MIHICTDSDEGESECDENDDKVLGQLNPVDEVT